MLAAPHCALARGDLLDRPADVDRRGFEAARVAPGDRAVEGEVELEDSGAVAEAPQSTPVAGGQGVRGDRGELARVGVEEEDARGGQVGGGADAEAGVHDPAQRREVTREGARDRDRAAARDRPLLYMGREREDQRQRRGRRVGQRQDRVRGAASPQGARRHVAERGACKPGRWPQRERPEADELRRPRRPAERAQDVGEQGVRILEQRGDEPAPGGGVHAEFVAGSLDRAPQQHGRSVVERVGNRGPGADPLEPVLGQRQAAEEGREDAQRMGRGAHVVQEAGQGEFGRPGAPADRVGTLVHGDLRAGAREFYRGCEPVGARTDHHCVEGSFRRIHGPPCLPAVVCPAVRPPVLPPRGGFCQKRTGRWTITRNDSLPTTSARSVPPRSRTGCGCSAGRGCFR